MTNLVATINALGQKYSRRYRDIPLIELFAYALHVLFIAVTTMGWCVRPSTALLLPVVGLSWELNDDYCLLTQLEEKCFDRALIPGRIPISSRMLLWADVALFIYVHHC